LNRRPFYYGPIGGFIFIFENETTPPPIPAAPAAQAAGNSIGAHLIGFKFNYIYIYVLKFRLKLSYWAFWSIARGHMGPSGGLWRGLWAHLPKIISKIFLKTELESGA
jgi:hypothetical protein